MQELYRQDDRFLINRITMWKAVADSVADDDCILTGKQHTPQAVVRYLVTLTDGMEKSREVS